MSDRDTATVLLIDEVSGIHIPKKFYENFDLSMWNLQASDYLCLSSPEHSDYWEAWHDVLQCAKLQDEEGRTWTLYQDGSLYAIRNERNVTGE